MIMNFKMDMAISFYKEWTRYNKIVTKLEKVGPTFFKFSEVVTIYIVSYSPFWGLVVSYRKETIHYFEVIHDSGVI